MFVTLGIIEAPVVGAQLGILFLAFDHLLGLRGVLKVLYREKVRVRGRVSLFFQTFNKEKFYGRERLC